MPFDLVRTFPEHNASLYQGSVPYDFASQPGHEAIEVVVLSAREFQNVPLPAHVTVFRAVLDDDAPADRHLERIKLAASQVASCLRSGKSVLVTCAAGLNRSGVITARALTKMGLEVQAAIDLVRKARGPIALSNPHFVAFLKREQWKQHFLGVEV